MAISGKGTRIVYLRLICLEPPQTDGETIFGIQDRQQVVHQGNIEADGSISYDFDMSARYDSAKNSVRLAGSFVHGTPTAPFLYLSLRRGTGEPVEWIRRLKISLAGLTWERINSSPTDTLFVGRVAGTSSGTVPLLDGDWAAVENL